MADTPAEATSSAISRASDPLLFRRVLGHYPTGVTVVTAIGEDGVPQGMVVGSFTSVSLDPPLVAFLPASNSGSWARLRPAGRFCVNILGAGHERLCRQFAARTGDKYEAVSWRPAPSGSPIIDGAVAWIDCETETVHQAGDHDIVIGRVLDLDTVDKGLPLLFFRGGYGSFTPHIMVVSDDRYAAELALIDRARHLLEGAAHSLRGRVAVLSCDGHTSTVLAAAGYANDPHVAQAAIGEPVPLAAPIGIWWMAQAEPDIVREWLGPLPGPERERVTEVMRLIRRDGGLCAGIASVQDGLEYILEQRAGGRRRSPVEEAQMLSHLAQDPQEFIASRFDRTETAGEHPRVRSFWSPVFDRDGRVVLGVMATGFAADQPLADAADAVRHLARSIGALT